MLLAVRTIQYCLCLVSMVLTALFAVSLTGIELGHNEESEITVSSVAALSLFVLIGICIDLGKYLYWINNDKGKWYVWISIVLTVFSLIASCAFFVSAEYTAIEAVENEYSYSLKNQARIETVTDEIRQQEKLLENRLASRYHEQWKEAEKTTIRIRELNEELLLLQEAVAEEGVQYAQEKISVTRFFTSVGDLLTVDPALIRNAFYMVLAILLEVSALASISLSNALKYEESIHQSKKSNCSKASNLDANPSPNTERLINDIQKGIVPPVIRKIRTAGYGLSIDDIRKILVSLYDSGALQKDKRNSYKLSEGDS